MRPLSAALAVLLLIGPVARAAPAQRSTKTSATSTKRVSKKTASKTASKSTSKSASKSASKSTAKASEEAPEPAEEPASADEPPAFQQSPEESAAKPAEKPSDAPVGQTEPKPIPGTQEPSLDFDLLQPAPAADVAQNVNPELEHKVHQRRSMLKLHQGLGFVMAASLTTTVILGQLDLNDSFRGGQDSRKLLPWHTGFAIGTTALFATVGLLGVLAPTPYPKESKWDTVRFHKLFMALATAGMVTQFALGLLAVGSHGEVKEVRLATAHQVVGYMTLGAVAAGMVALTF